MDENTLCRICLENGANLPIFEKNDDESNDIQYKFNFCLKEKASTYLYLNYEKIIADVVWKYNFFMFTDRRYWGLSALYMSKMQWYTRCDV